MKKVVIIGGGYAGTYALRELVKNKNIKITLIDQNIFHNLQLEVYDLTTSMYRFQSYGVLLLKLIQTGYKKLKKL
jgi:NADH dehydrogenase